LIDVSNELVAFETPVTVWRSTLRDIPDDLKLSDTSLWNGISYIKRVCRWHCHKHVPSLYPWSSGSGGWL